MAAWLFGSGQTPLAEYDAALEEATSELLPTPSLSTLPPDLLEKCLRMSDMVRSGQVKGPEAVKGFKRRLVHTNPNVQLLALFALDVAIKNSGDAFLKEAASGTAPAVSSSTDTSLVETIGNLARGSNNDVRTTTLRLLQNWATAFEQKPHLAISQMVLLYRRLKAEGSNFPPRDASATAAMIDSLAAPEWAEADVCSRCRDPFTMTNRRHHCRNCGQIFDQKCSSKSIPLPHFGINHEVRVCEGCHKKIASGRRGSITSGPTSPSRASSLRHSLQARSPYSRSQEDADLQAALRMSLNEVQPSERPGYRAREEPKGRRIEEVEDPELAAAIEASLREYRAPQPSAPSATTGPTGQRSVQQPEFRAPPPIDLSAGDSDALLHFAQTASRRELGVHALAPLYDRAAAAGPGLVRAVGDAGKRQQILLEMNDKLMHAVKMYDGLLERQVSRHAYRAGPQAPSYVQNGYAGAAPPPIPQAPGSSVLQHHEPAYAPIYPAVPAMNDPTQAASPASRHAWLPAQAPSAMSQEPAQQVSYHAQPAGFSDTRPLPPNANASAATEALPAAGLAHYAPPTSYSASSLVVAPQHAMPAQQVAPPQHVAPAHQAASAPISQSRMYTAASFPSVPTSEPVVHEEPAKREEALIEF